MPTSEARLGKLPRLKSRQAWHMRGRGASLAPWPTPGEGQGTAINQRADNVRAGLDQLCHLTLRIGWRYPLRIVRMPNRDKSLPL